MSVAIDTASSADRDFSRFPALKVGQPAGWLTSGRRADPSGWRSSSHAIGRGAPKPREALPSDLSWPDSLGAVPRCYVRCVPTKHPRVSVTLTPPLQEARAELRRRGVDVSVAALALAGAREMLAATAARDADEWRRAELRGRLVRRLRSGALDAA